MEYPYTILFLPIPAYSCLFQPSPAYSGLIQSIPFFQFVPTFFFFCLFQLIPACFSISPPISVYSILFQPIPIPNLKSQILNLKWPIVHFNPNWIFWLLFLYYICPTLRSWLHETSALIMTLSPGLEKIYTSERSSNSFPGTTFMSGRLENCKKSIPKSWGSPIQGTISDFLLNYGTDLSPC